MQQAFIYTLKVWLTCIFVTPIIAYLFLWIFSVDITLVGALIGMFAYVLIGGFISFCSFLMVFMFTYIFIKQSFSEVRVKLFISFLTLLLFIGEILWLNHGELVPDDRHKAIILAFYPVLGLMSVWFHKLMPDVDRSVY